MDVGGFLKHEFVPPPPSPGEGDTRFNGLGEDVSFRSLL